MPSSRPHADPLPSLPDDRAGGARGRAWFADRELRDAVEHVPDVAADPGRLRTPGSWVLVGDFEGPVAAWRFAERRMRTSARASPPAGRSSEARTTQAWQGPAAADWTTSMDEGSYTAAVAEVRETIREGGVYQANLCRMLSAPLAAAPAGPPTVPSAGAPCAEPDARELARVLERGNPAPYAGGVHVPTGVGVPSVWVVTASPELYLRLADGWVTSAPIKGTARTVDGLTEKDRAENVMITDLVRNDLQQVCVPGTVEVTTLLGVEEHPGLVHLVSTVRGRLDPALLRSPDLWSRLLGATYPPGSVSGAPKRAALATIDRLEPVPRGPYCGTVGWVDVDQDGEVRAELAVGIRTFVWRDGTLRFGTGAGITWGSDPTAEWQETELKARRLVGLASGAGDQDADAPPAAAACAGAACAGAASGETETPPTVRD